MGILSTPSTMELVSTETFLAPGCLSVVATQQTEHINHTPKIDKRMFCSNMLNYVNYVYMAAQTMGWINTLIILLRKLWFVHQLSIQQCIHCKQQEIKTRMRSNKKIIVLQEENFSIEL